MLLVSVTRHPNEQQHNPLVQNPSKQIPRGEERDPLSFICYPSSPWQQQSCSKCFINQTNHRMNILCKNSVCLKTSPRLVMFYKMRWVFYLIIKFTSRSLVHELLLFFPCSAYAIHHCPDNSDSVANDSEANPFTETPHLPYNDRYLVLHLFHSWRKGRGAAKNTTRALSSYDRYLSGSCPKQVKFTSNFQCVSRSLYILEDEAPKRHFPAHIIHCQHDNSSSSAANDSSAKPITTL